MRVDTLKTGFTYVIALVVLIGAGFLLVIPTEVDKSELLPFLTAVVGAVIAYVFAREQTQIVQAGNGVERTRVDDVSRKLDAVLLAMPAATRPHRATDPITAEHVEVAGEHVEVRS